MEYLMLWVADESLSPSDPEERMKLIMSNLESIKKSTSDGSLKMWGMSPGGGHGYALFEGDGKEMFAACAQYTPRIEFEIRPMLSIDEVLETVKGMQK